MLNALLIPYAAVTIGMGADVDAATFTWGDGILQQLDVTLSEGKDITNCSISIYDKDGIYANKFFTYAKEIDGLEPLTLEETKDKKTALPNSASGDLKRVLDMIAWAEGTAALGDGGYNVMFTRKLFNGYAKHPAQLQCSGSLCSDAAGRYQFLSTTWNPLASTIGVTDFSPASQDAGAIQLLKNRGAYEYAKAGNWPAMLDEISYEWASIPASNGSYRYPGQGTKTPQQIYDFLGGVVREEDKAKLANAVPPAAPKGSPGRETTLAGQQMTVYLGFDGEPVSAYSFIHTSLQYSLFDESVLVFTGSAASWTLNQEKRNSSFINITLKQLATKIAAKYNMTVEMKIDGPTYIYIAQNALSDFEFLQRECERVGLIFKNVGTNKIEITSRDDAVLAAADNVFTIDVNSDVTTFNLSHQAQGSSSGGARSVDSPTKSGEKKYTLNPDTGTIEVAVGAKVEDKPANADKAFTTTGDNVAPNKPLTTGATDTEDASRADAKARIKGILADFSVPATIESLGLTPDDVVRTIGWGEAEKDGSFLDRLWVIESVTHSLSDSYTTSATVYTPLKNKYPAPDEKKGAKAGGGAAGSNTSGTTNIGGFIVPTSGYLTSPFGPRNGRNHNGVDIAEAHAAPVYAAAAGTVVDVQTGCQLGDGSCGGGYGNLVEISHPIPEGGYKTIYAHLETVDVTMGASVAQGQKIGTQGDTGASRGRHLHWGVSKNGTYINPASVVSLSGLK
jgi:murein DD-endopeptidase MepM/ murein hydrolase activator NlpD/muramidase (phage lysozyme)